MKTSKPTIRIFRVDTTTEISLPFADGGVKCGFPSPAQDYVEESIDLNKTLIDSKESTFLGRVEGDSMKDRGINHNDLLIIDKSKEARHGDVVVAYIDGEFTIKTLDLTHEKDGYIELVPANDAYPIIKITAEETFRVWGVVTYNIHKLY